MRRGTSELQGLRSPIAARVPSRRRGAEPDVARREPEEQGPAEQAVSDRDGAGQSSRRAKVQPAGRRGA
jgi:hypothetical protein